MTIQDTSATVWQRSSKCAGGDCVEVARLSRDRVAIRNSMYSESQTIILSEADYQDLIASIKQA